MQNAEGEEKGGKEECRKCVCVSHTKVAAGSGVGCVPGLLYRVRSGADYRIEYSGWLGKPNKRSVMSVSSK